MTLEELQAEFPHGSHWRHGGRTVSVLGWREPDAVVIIDETGSPSVDPQAWSSYGLRAWKRIPDPTPCPITEPVTLLGFSDCWKANMPYDVRRYGQHITLAPDGAGGIRATWEGGPP